jgi:hypothetical protein
LFLGRLCCQGITENFIFHGKNKYRIRVSVCTKKLINIKVRKMQIFALKCTFLGQSINNGWTVKVATSGNPHGGFLKE